MEKLKLFLTNHLTKIIGIGTLIGMVVGAITWYNSSNYPRFAFHSEVNKVVQWVAKGQMDQYRRAIRSDERFLFDLDKQINKLKEQNKDIPEVLIQQRLNTMEEIEYSKSKLKIAEQVAE